MVSKIGIFAGGGKLPMIIGKNLIDSRYEVVFFCIDKFANLKLYKKYNFEKVSISSLSKILYLLKKHSIQKIIMAGHVKRPSVKDIKFDLNTLKLIKNFALDSKGDDKLLTSISIFFKNAGFPMFDWKNKCKNIFATEKFLSVKKPSKESLLNKDKGINFFNKIGKTDLTQSLIIQNKIILGIEAAEGTDELIKRCFKYKKKGDGGILLKLSKYNQDTNLDIPVIGLKTVQKIKKYNYEGIFLEKNKCIIIDKEKVINFCNINKLFLSCISKN